MEGPYFDIFAEYAKQDIDDILIRITIANRGPEPADLNVSTDAVVSEYVGLVFQSSSKAAAARELIGRAAGRP
jgi:hypothetical protein